MGRILLLQNAWFFILLDEQKITILNTSTSLQELFWTRPMPFHEEFHSSRSCWWIGPTTILALQHSQQHCYLSRPSLVGLIVLRTCILRHCDLVCEWAPDTRCDRAQNLRSCQYLRVRLDLCGFCFPPNLRRWIQHRNFPQKPKESPNFEAHPESQFHFFVCIFERFKKIEKPPILCISAFFFLHPECHHRVNQIPFPKILPIHWFRVVVEIELEVAAE